MRCKHHGIEIRNNGIGVHIQTIKKRATYIAIKSNQENSTQERAIREIHRARLSTAWSRVWGRVASFFNKVLHMVI